MDDSSSYHTTHTTVSIMIKVSSNTKEHPGCVSLACEASVEFDESWSWWCLLRAERNSFTVAEHMDVRWSSLADGTFSSKSWYFILSHRRWSDLLCCRRCLHDHPHQTLEKEMLQCTPQLVQTVAKEIMKVESSKQIGSQTCCSVTIDSKCHLVAPAVSTDDCPVIQEDAHRRLSEEEQRTLDLATEEERETARNMVSRLHVELGPSDPRGTMDSLRRKHAQRLIITTAKKFSCSACEDSQRRRLRPVTARVLHELGTCLQVDQFEWRHPVLNLHVLGTITVDAGSRAASVTIHRVMDTEHGLGNVTDEYSVESLGQELWQTRCCQNRSRRSFLRSRISTWSGCQEYTP